MRKRLFVFEKKAAMENILKYLDKDFSENDTAIIAPTISAFKFDYPKELHYKSVPFFNEDPKYKNNFENISYMKFCKGREENVKPFKDFQLLNLNKLNNIKQFLQSLDEIICFNDPDHTGIRGFEFYFNHYLKINLKDITDIFNIKITFVDTYNGFDKDSILKSYKNRVEIKDSKKYQQLKSTYLKKDFFEYNYNLNSIILFRSIIKDKTFNNITLTKNMIQTLYLIKINQYSEGVLIQKMYDLEIGSPASRHELIRYLKNINFIEESFNKELNIKIIKLSKNGELFIDFLHPITKDFKLSIKLNKDYSAISFEDFKLKWNNYLKKTFKKQKNYLRKLS